MTWLLFSFGIIFFYTSLSINKIEANFSSHRVISLQFCASRTDLFLRQLCSWPKCFILTQAKAIPIRKSRACVVEDTCTIHSLQKVISSLSWEKKHFRVYSVICTTKSIKCVLRCLKTCELNYTLRNKETEKYERVACIALRNEAYVNSLLPSYSKKNEQTNKTKQK